MKLEINFSLNKDIITFIILYYYSLLLFFIISIYIIKILLNKYK